MLFLLPITYTVFAFRLLRCVRKGVATAQRMVDKNVFVRLDSKVYLDKKLDIIGSSRCKVCVIA